MNGTFIDKQFIVALAKNEVVCPRAISLFHNHKQLQSLVQMWEILFALVSFQKWKFNWSFVRDKSSARGKSSCMGHMGAIEFSRNDCIFSCS